MKCVFVCISMCVVWEMSSKRSGMLQIKLQCLSLRDWGSWKDILQFTFNFKKKPRTHFFCNLKILKKNNLKAGILFSDYNLQKLYILSL